MTGVTAALAAVVVVLLVATAWLAVSRQAARRKAAALAARLSAADDHLLRAADLQARLELALDEVPLAVIVVAEDGSVAHRNRVGRDLLAARHGGALVQRVVEEMSAAPAQGTRMLELHGPPRRSYEVWSAPLGGGRAGTVIVAEDVTARERLDAVRRDFVANVSHELKTPVGALTVLADALHGAVEDGDTDAIARFTDRMQGEATRLAELVRDLLDLSRADAIDDSREQPVDVDHVVREGVARVADEARGRDVAIEVDAADAGVVLGDRAALVTALRNLVENAVRYSPPRTTVRIASRIAGATVEIEVRDEGVGIPADQIGRVFERFYRVDRARSRETGGSGLGLSIVRHVVERHGGSVDVESTEGRGSTFRVRLPAFSPPEAVAT